MQHQNEAEFVTRAVVQPDRMAECMRGEEESEGVRIIL